jgi:hypothetical protein
MRRRAVDELVGEESPDLAELRRGWCLGGASFRERMLGLIERMASKRTTRTRRDAVVERQHGLEEARRIMETGLRCLGLKEEELATLPKGDERKSAIAAEIRRRTAVPNAWIAEALQLGHVSRVSHCARKKSDPKLTKKLAECLAA